MPGRNGPKVWTKGRPKWKVLLKKKIEIILILVVIFAMDLIWQRIVPIEINLMPL